MDTNMFEHKLCGRRIDAQVNPVKNTLGIESPLRIFGPVTAKEKVLEVLIKRHLEKLKSCDSAALEVLRKNPYYRGFLNLCSGGVNFYKKGGLSKEVKIHHEEITEQIDIKRDP